MHKKFEINRTKIKAGCQLVRKVVTHNSKSDLPLVRHTQTLFEEESESIITGSCYEFGRKFPSGNRAQSVPGTYLQTYVLLLVVPSIDHLSAFVEKSQLAASQCLFTHF